MSGQRDVVDQGVGVRPVAALSRGERVAAAVIGVLALLIAVAGFVVSFDAVSDAVRPFFGDLAPLVPLSVDLGILVFSALHLLLARLDMPMPVLRLVPWTLTGATVWLNLEAAGSQTLDQLAHGVMPGLWVVFVEVATHATKVRAGLVSGKRMERIRRSRWLLAPISTVVLWRRMVLWEITDYRAALGMERDRLLARAALREAYGWSWRWSAPLADRVRLRLGMTPAVELTTSVRDLSASDERLSALAHEPSAPGEPLDGRVWDVPDPWQFAVPVGGDLSGGQPQASTGEATGELRTLDGRTDAELLRLLAPAWQAEGPLTRYRIERLTGASARQAQRLRDALAESEQNGEQAERTAEQLAERNGRRPD